jgi:hypothetical protein
MSATESAYWLGNKGNVLVFAKVLGFERWEDRLLTGDVTVTAVIKNLREVLGTDELNLLQSELVRQALAKMQDSGQSAGWSFSL